jgi:hypothetical protein
MWTSVLRIPCKKVCAEAATCLETCCNLGACYKVARNSLTVLV